MEHNFVKIIKQSLRFAFIIIFATGGCLHAQIDTAFWFAAPDLAADHQQTPIQFCFTTFDQPATITIEQPANSDFTPFTLTLPADSFYVYDLSNRVDSVETKPINTVVNWGFHISSTADISCYYESVGNNSEMYTLKGRNAIGTYFIVPMQTYFRNGNSNNSSIEIVATEDNTIVQINAPVALKGNIAANTTVTITLQRGQSYSIQAASADATSHLHNTIIHSNKPIVVNSTDDSVDSNAGCRDLVGDQVVPVSMFGMRYAAIRSYSSNDIYEQLWVFPSEDNTTVWLNGNQRAVSLGSYINIQLDSAVTLVTSDKPIAVFQTTATGCEQGGTMLPDMECTGSYSVTHLRPNIASMIVTIVVATVHTGDFVLNGNTTAITAADFLPVPLDSSISYCCKDISAFVPIGSIMKLENRQGRFQLGILDGDEGGSCSYGFFSDYSKHTFIQFDMDSVYREGDTVPFIFSAIYTDSIVLVGPSGLRTTTFPFSIHGINRADSGWYYIIGFNTTDCFYMAIDSIFIIILDSTINRIYLDSTVCENQLPVVWHGHTFFSERTICDYDNGSDSIVYMTLHVNPTYHLHFYDTIIEGETYSFEGQTFDSPGVYDFFISTVDFLCDSIRTLHLRVFECKTHSEIRANPTILTRGNTQFTVSDVVNHAIPNRTWFINGIQQSENGPILHGQAPPDVDSIVVSMEISKGNCYIIDSVILPVINVCIFAPNVFTPQEPYNNRFYIVTKDVINAELFIYNRSGEQVFRTTDIEQGWDGKYNGSYCPQGNYVWLLKYRSKEYPNVFCTEKGSVLILK